MVPVRRVALLSLAAALAACGASAPAPRTPGTLRAQGATGLVDPTVKNARLVPADLDLDKPFGVEPGGGVRTITEGVRVVNLARGGAISARDRLPQAPNDIVPIPARMGGGFFYLIGNTVWRSSTWLSKPMPVFRPPQSVTKTFVGLDRLYLKLQGGSYVALDARTGAATDLGPLPGTPFLTSMIAVDGWHAVAIADLRGVVATDDAGVTWRSLKVPFEPSELRRVGDAVFVGARGGGANRGWVEVQRGGFVLKATPPATDDKSDDESVDALTRTFGRRPLSAAIEDGWPLADGTVVVARDGELLRLRLADGAVVEHAGAAYPLKPSRCHPLAMGAPGAFGFVCGEPKGKTEVYDFADGKMTLARAFDRARSVSASGNGSIVIQGGCDADAAPDDASSPERMLCIRSRTGEWREVRLKDPTCVRKSAVNGCEEYARDQRVVQLASGSLVVLSPPEAGNLQLARLTILEPGSTAPRSVPLAFDSTNDTTASVLRALRLGMWMEGFEERAPGVISGWVELGGALLGVHIKVDGHARHGVLLHDAGTMLASGRYGIGFAGGHRGYETTDGGLTWAPIDLPDPVAQGRVASTRACGPVGCAIAGWLRVGWGGAPPDETAGAAGPLPTIAPLTTKSSVLSLTCEALKTTPPAPTVAEPVAMVSDDPWRSRYGHYYPSSGYGVVGSRPKHTYNWTPFFSAAAPKLGDADLGFSNEARDAAGLAGPTARFYAWGPKEGEWDAKNKWIVRWMWPFGFEVKGTQASPTPRAVVESSGFLTLLSSPQPRGLAWTAHPGDDAGHTLLIGRPTSGSSVDQVAYDLEEGHAAVEVRRGDGDTLPEVESTVRAAGRWFVATQQGWGAGVIPATVLWEIDGGVARELVRLPRANDGTRVAVRLSRRADGRAIGVMVDGQPSAERPSTAQRWVVPVDVETGAIGEPERLGPIDLGDRAVTLCRDGEGGWVVDVPWSPTVRVDVGVGTATLRNALARVHLSAQSACVERLSANGDVDSGKGVKLAASVATAEVSVLGGGARHLLRCAAR